MFTYRLFNPVVPEPIQEQSEVELSPTPAIPSTYSFTATTSAQSALDLVESQIDLRVKEYDFGLMVEGVNGLLADEKHYWALYHNGDYAKVGIADLKLEKDETIELRYEEIIL
jgi:hypothetical protein